jgi:AraC-like DNA-binding protein
MNRPESHGEDVLSSALRLLEASGSMFFRGCFASPWAVDIPGARDVAELLGADPEGDAVLLFHTVLRGAPRLHIDGPETGRVAPRDGLQLSAGDLVVLNAAAGHRLGEGRSTQRLAMRSLMASEGEPPLMIDYGPNDSTTMICGGFIFRNTTLDPMLASLPALVHVRADQTTTTIATILQLMGVETGTAGPGSDIFLSRLSDLLLIEVLRRVASTLSRGWLAATTDRVVGPALAAMHSTPARDWTLPELAKRSGVSRSGFSARFRQQLGESPGQYLTKLRMRMAEKLLQEPQRTVAEVSEMVGYDSVEGFSRMFKRVHGLLRGDPVVLRSAWTSGHEVRAS